MLVLARESRGHSQGAMAKALSINRTTMLRYESGLLEVPRDRLSEIATLLRYPTSFFYFEERLYNTSCMYHRKRKSISAREMEMKADKVDMTPALTFLDNLKQTVIDAAAKGQEVTFIQQYHTTDVVDCKGLNDKAITGVTFSVKVMG